MVKCTFCSITARVPGKLARRQRQGAPPPLVPFWVLLEGLSPGRKKLLRGRSEDDDDNDDDNDSDDDEDGAVADGGPPLASASAVPPWAHPNLHRAPATKGSMTGIVIGIAVVVVLLQPAVNRSSRRFDSSRWSSRLHTRSRTVPELEAPSRMSSPHALTCVRSCPCFSMVEHPPRTRCDPVRLRAWA
jgi:hypothetical protein